MTLNPAQLLLVNRVSNDLLNAREKLEHMQTQNIGIEVEVVTAISCVDVALASVRTVIEEHVNQQ